MAWRVILGGVLGGLVLFFWGAAAHLATPLGTMGLSVLPTEKEPAVLAAMKDAVPGDGLYFYPGADMTRTRTDEENAAFEAKIKAGPSGLLLIHPNGGTTMTPKELLTELATDVAVALIGALLLSATRLGYVGRVGFVALLGQLGWLSISLSYWNWYGYPTAYVLAEALTEGIGWLLAGLLVAAIVRPARVATPALVTAA